jgi:hypothetical protein
MPHISANNMADRIIIKGDYAEIILYNRKKQEVGRAKVDIKNLERIKQFPWYRDSSGYAAGGKKIHNMRMHVFILGKPRIKNEIDHVNRDKLDNREENLRFVSHGMNMRNTGKAACYYSKQNRKWCLQTSFLGKRYTLGCVTDEKEARGIAMNLKILMNVAQHTV